MLYPTELRARDGGKRPVIFSHAAGKRHVECRRWRQAGTATPSRPSYRQAEAREAFRDEHHDLRLAPEARNLRHTYAHPSDDGTTWRVEPVIRVLRLENLAP